jgi:hypothetical protein
MFVMLRRILGCVALCALVVATAAKADVRADASGPSAPGQSAPGQSATAATLTGIVVDHVGRALAGVAITLIDVAEGTQRRTVTGRTGAFAFATLTPGRYTLHADHVNFAPAEIRDIEVDGRVPTAITIALRIASVRETVAVHGQLSTAASGAATVGTVIDRQTIERVSANGRSVQSLLAFVPGVITAGGTTDASGAFSVNGQRSSANYFMIDGVGANIANAVNAPSRASQASGGALPGVTTLGTTASLTPFEALEEVRVQTSSYAAEYGRQPGAQVSLVTRAGSSVWRGTLFTQIRHEALDANDWFANRAGRGKLPMRQQQVGATLGGPLVWPGHADDPRTFVLVAHEQARVRSPQMVVSSVPTLALRQQASQGLRALLDAFPLPHTSAVTYGVAATLVGDDAARYRVGTTSVRVDHRVSSALSLFGRVNVAPSTSDAWKASNLATQHHEALAARTLTLGATHQSTRTATDLRINVSTNHGDVAEWQTDHLGATPVGTAQLTPSGTAGAFADALVTFPAFTTMRPVPSLSVLNSSTDQRQINVVGATTVATDRHRVKVGVDVRTLETRLRPRDYDLWVNLADTNSLRADSTAQVSLSAQPADLRPQFTNASLFVQDTWMASARVTIDAGVRWELNPPPGEAHGRLPYTSLAPFAVSTPVAPAGTPLWHTRAKNLAPRLGVGWRLRESPGRDTMLRVGGGLFYDLGNTQATDGYEGYGYRTSRDLLLQYPVDASSVATAASTSYPRNAPLFASDPNLTLPYSGQWNVSIEQGLGATQRLVVSYIGAAGTRQLAQLHREFLDVPAFQFPSVYVTTNDGRSDYEALQVRFEHRLSSRLAMSAAHTWSHAIDVTSVESRAEAASTMARADADFDVRHVFTGTFDLDLPAPTRLPLARAWLRDWSLDGHVSIQTGRPMNIMLTSLFDQQGIEHTVWAVRTGGVPMYVVDTHAPGGVRINAQAFRSFVIDHDYESNRNLVRGPGAWQVDLALRRVWTLVRAARLTTQVNAFNVLNHPNFGNVDPDLGSPTFGEARAMLGRTLGGLNPSYQIGGPRTLELSLRVSF